MSTADQRQFCDLATQLVTESRRSTASDNLLKYNDSLVRAIVREQRDLDKHIRALEATLAADAHADPDHIPPALLLYQTAITRNKRCLLAYHAHRTDRLRDMYWAAGCALPHLLGDADTRAKLAPHEVDFLRAYAASTIAFRETLAAELDITAGITHPPKDLHVHVRVVRDCGTIQTELGAVDFTKGQRFLIRRADVEHLVVQGYLEEIESG